MFKIGLCTLSDEYENRIKNLLKGILSEYEGIEYESIPASALLEKEKGKFSDIQVMAVDEQIFRTEGIETIEYLDRIRPDVSVLLFEGVRESAISGVRYHVYAYRMQRLKQSDLKREIVRKLRDSHDVSRCVTVKLEGNPIMVPIRHIKYIESSNRHIILHTIMGDYEYTEKMYVIERLLQPDGFVRCHQSFLVSRQFVTDVDSKGIWMDQECIPIGRKYRDGVREEFLFVDDNEGSMEEISEDMDADVKNNYVEDEHQGMRCEEQGIGYADRMERKTAEKNTEKQGILTGIRGIYEGAQFHLRPEQKILIGRDSKVADIVIDYPLISRLHCVIIYHEDDNMYEIVDFSKNGTFLGDKSRLASDTGYSLKPGTELAFGSQDNVYRLG